jgi:hypothetical protein
MRFRDVSQAQPTPFDYVSSMQPADRVNWCLATLNALFQAKNAPVSVSAVSLTGSSVVATRGRSASDGSDPLESTVDSSAGLDSSVEV